LNTWKVNICNHHQYSFCCTVGWCREGNWEWKGKRGRWISVDVYVRKLSGLEEKFGMQFQIGNAHSWKLHLRVYVLCINIYYNPPPIPLSTPPHLVASTHITLWTGMLLETCAFSTFLLPIDTLWWSPSRSLVGFAFFFPYLYNYFILWFELHTLHKYMVMDGHQPVHRVKIPSSLEMESALPLPQAHYSIWLKPHD
jgi:hypothetical protein